MAENDSRGFAVLIPAYNEERTIRGIVERAGRFGGAVIVVNDGSHDGTAAALEGAPVTLLNNLSNQGKGESLRRGARYALEQGADQVITLDGDGQHRPEDIPLLLRAAANHPNRIVIAARTRGREVAPPLRRFANRFADFWISWAAGHRIRDSQSGFRLYPRAVFEGQDASAAGFTFESEILINAAQRGIETIAVEIDTIYAKGARRSHYRPASDTASIVRMVAWKLLRRGMYPVGLARALGLIR